MKKVNKKLASPTRIYLHTLDMKCDDMPCQDPCNERNCACDKCKISDKYEKISGIRIEDLDGAEIIDPRD